jgi:pilus assembly protein CpaC
MIKSVKCRILAALLAAALAVATLPPAALAAPRPDSLTAPRPDSLAAPRPDSLAAPRPGSLAAPRGDSAAREAAARAADPHQLELNAGGGRVLILAAPASNVFVADPKIAEVRPATASTLFVFGLAPGETTIAAVGADGQPLADYDVMVHPSNFAAGEAAAAIARELPGVQVQVRARAKGLVVTGAIATPEQHAQLLSIVRGYLADGQTLDDETGLTNAVQVTLKVRIAQMSRSVTRQLGINWQAAGTIGKGALSFATSNPIAATAATTGLGTAALATKDVSAMIDALAQDNLAHILAEPTLTVMSGQPGKFLSGGEFPVPVGQQNNSVTIEFKNYGVKLDFVPTVLSSGRINLHVAPEVSQLSTAGAVQLAAGNSTIQVPSLVVQRAETAVELGSGQSFAIAGLLQDTSTDNASGTPFLGEVPVLGALFRSDSFNREESELVILVTPYIVRPVDNPAALHVAAENQGAPSELERLLLLRQVAAGRPAVPMRIPGYAGFVAQ